MVKGSLGLGAAVLVGTVMFGTAASAQSAAPECGAIQKTLAERKALVSKANAASQSKKKMTPQEACALFGKLQANGAEVRSVRALSADEVAQEAARLAASGAEATSNRD